MVGDNIQSDVMPAELSSVCDVTICRPRTLRQLAAAGFCLLAMLLVTDPHWVLAQDAADLRAAAAVERVMVNAIDKAGKSVVAIARVDPLETPRNGDRLQPRQRSPSDPGFIPDHFGTGVIVDRAGFIVTQYHVIGSKSEHYVTTVERNVYRATVQGADPRSDLAVLKLDATDLARNGEYLTPIHFGDTSKLKRGQIVVALGNPYAIAADGQASASRGIIANLSRKIPPNGGEGATKDKLYHFGTLIQTDAKLNLGTSGGALINMNGEMIGLTTALAATAGYEQAAGYAIPADDVFVRAIEAMKQGREVEYGFLGVVPESLALDERANGGSGVLVSTVFPGTPADQSGLQAGDVVTYVDQQPVKAADSLMLAVGRKPVESLVRLTVLRDKKPRNFEVKLAKFPVTGTKVVTSQPPAWRGLRIDYSTASIEEFLKVRHTELLKKGCVLITEVERDSPAWDAKLRPGMFVTEIGGVKVVSPKDFRTATLGKNGRIELKVFDTEQIKTPETRVLLPASS